MTNTTLHVVFDADAAERLREALPRAGLNDPVACLADDLSLGPIDPLDLQGRRDWAEVALGPFGDDHFAADGPEFWRAGLSTDRRLVAWMSRRVAREYAGFLEWLWRLGDRPCDVVDLTDVAIPSALAERRAVSLAYLSPDEIVRHRLLGRAAPLADAARGRYHALWQRLRAENAPLRVLEAEELRSAPITYFDERLLSCTVAQWRKVARVVGDFLYTYDGATIWPTSIPFVSSRIRALADAGHLEARGNVFRIRYSEVRRPAGQESQPTPA